MPRALPTKIARTARGWALYRLRDGRWRLVAVFRTRELARAKQPKKRPAKKRPAKKRPGKKRPGKKRPGKKRPAKKRPAKKRPAKKRGRTAAQIAQAIARALLRAWDAPDDWTVRRRRKGGLDDARHAATRAEGSLFDGWKPSAWVETPPDLARSIEHAIRDPRESAEVRVIVFAEWVDAGWLAISRWRDLLLGGDSIVSDFLDRLGRIASGARTKSTRVLADDAIGALDVRVTLRSALEVERGIELDDAGEPGGL